MCGREVTGWYVLGLDAAIVTCTSRKEGAAGTFKGSFGRMPLGAWAASTRECVAMLLRPGSAAQRRRRPQERSGRSPAAAPAAAVAEAAGPHRRCGLEPRRPRPPPESGHQPAPGALDDRLGRQRHSRHQGTAPVPSRSRPSHAAEASRRHASPAARTQPPPHQRPPGGPTGPAAPAKSTPAARPPAHPQHPCSPRESSAPAPPRQPPGIPPAKTTTMINLS